MVPEILKAIEELPVDEKRAVQSDYLELVFMTADRARWEEQLASVLGPPVKPGGSKPSKDDEAITGRHGGIGQEQVLYRRDAGGVSHVAMLWPWRDNEHITLKIASIGGEAAAAAPQDAAALAPVAYGPGPLVWVLVGVLALVAVLTALYWFFI